MRTGIFILCLSLISSLAYGQRPTPKEPPVFDKKLWTVTGILVGSSIALTETSVRRSANDRSDKRVKIYIAHGISDFLIFGVTANLKSDNKKWWWVGSIATSALYGGVAIKYNKSF